MANGGLWRWGLGWGTMRVQLQGRHPVGGGCEHEASCIFHNFFVHLCAWGAPP